MQIVKRLIAQRGRESYAEAAAHLKQVRNLFQRTGEMAAWQALIANLRQQHRALRALQDELKQAGL